MCRFNAISSLIFTEVFRAEGERVFGCSVMIQCDEVIQAVMQTMMQSDEVTLAVIQCDEVIQAVIQCDTGSDTV